MADSKIMQNVRNKRSYKLSNRWYQFVRNTLEKKSDKGEHLNRKNTKKFENIETSKSKTVLPECIPSRGSRTRDTINEKFNYRKFRKRREHNREH